MQTWNNGPHLLEFEEPDIFHCHIRGPMPVDEAKETIRVLKEVETRAGPVYFFVYLDEGFPGRLESETRKYFGSLQTPWKAAATIGGNAVARTMTNVIFRAMALISGNRAPMRMVKNVEEAHAFAAELRAAEKSRAARS